ncbi:unnamed protein product [Gadus morhua 'NCC']
MQLCGKAGGGPVIRSERRLGDRSGLLNGGLVENPPTWQSPGGTRLYRPDLQRESSSAAASRSSQECHECGTILPLAVALRRPPDGSCTTALRGGSQHPSPAALEGEERGDSGENFAHALSCDTVTFKLMELLQEYGTGCGLNSKSFVYGEKFFIAVEDALVFIRWPV